MLNEKNYNNYNLIFHNGALFYFKFLNLSTLAPYSAAKISLYFKKSEFIVSYFC